MKSAVTKRIIRVVVVALIVIALIYGYSFAFKNNKANEAAPIGLINPSPAPSSSIQSPRSSRTPDSSTPVIMAEGSFRSAPNERAAGTAQLIIIGDRIIVRFENDFNLVTNPDPIVTFGNNDKADLTINLGAIKGSKGSQNYDVPASIDVSKYSQIIVYCRDFRVPLGFADLIPK